MPVDGLSGSADVCVIELGGTVGTVLYPLLLYGCLGVGVIQKKSCIWELIPSILLGEKHVIVDFSSCLLNGIILPTVQVISSLCLLLKLFDNSSSELVNFMSLLMQRSTRGGK